MLQIWDDYLIKHINICVLWIQKESIKYIAVL